MKEIFVPIQLTPNLVGIFLKPLCGSDELAVDNRDTRNAIDLLDRLVVRKQLPDNFTSADLVTADRDRAIAAIYVATFGPKIDSTVTCGKCQQYYDLDFFLKDLLDHYNLSDVKSSDGTYSIDSGTVFRLPTGVDELSLEGMTGEAAENLLLLRCIVNGKDSDNGDVQKKMAELAPILNVYMQANCPECGHVQEIAYDIQSFLLTKLQQEKPRLIQEIHRIATAYHWAPDVILALPRGLRKKYVSLIESET